MKHTFLVKQIPRHSRSESQPYQTGAAANFNHYNNTGVTHLSRALVRDSGSNMWMRGHKLDNSLD